MSLIPDLTEPIPSGNKLVWRTEGKRSYLHTCASDKDIQPDDIPFHHVGITHNIKGKKL